MNNHKKPTKFSSLLGRLDTIEKRSFWTIAPVVMLVGLCAVFFGDYMSISAPVTITLILCVIAPLVLMMVCLRGNYYNVCYPILCFLVSGIAVPVIFPAGGGFYSGMPIFCLSTTIICVFCYEKLWRYLSFIFSVVANMTVFYLCKYGIFKITPIQEGYETTDIIYSYLILSIGLFLIINMMINQVRIFATSDKIMEDYMDSSVRSHLLKKVKNSNINLEGSKVWVTVLFADISRFTTTTETMAPETAAGYLNTFLSIADECIHANKGILDKYIGDCVMAYWIDYDRVGYGAREAIQTVKDIRDRLYSQEQELFREYGFEMDFSAGISYGGVVMGDIGSEHRKEFTIIGDAVNTASRIQGMASMGELLISDEVADFVNGWVKLSPVEVETYLRGKNKPLVLFRVEGIAEESGDKIKLAGTPENKNPYNLYVCGCRGSFPVSGIRFSEFGGQTSCYILKKKKYALVIDCGTGLGNAGDILKDCEKIDILLTHVHYDHIMGLLDMSVFPERVKLRMYGHFGGWAGDDTIYNFMDAPYWPVNLPEIEYIDIMLGTVYDFPESIQATFYRADHPNDGCIIKLMAGPHKICVYADMEDPTYMDPEIARNAEILIYDGMYDEEQAEMHEGWGHSSWQVGVRYGIEEDVKRLIITHHNPVNDDHVLRNLEDRARELFPRCVFARSGDRYTL